MYQAADGAVTRIFGYNGSIRPKGSETVGGQSPSRIGKLSALSLGTSAPALQVMGI